MMGTKVAKQSFHYKSTEYRAIGRPRNRWQWFTCLQRWWKWMYWLLLLLLLLLLLYYYIIIIIIIISQDKISGM